MDLSNEFDMGGVTEQSGQQELAAGTYVVRIEDIEKKGTKDKVDPETGAPHPDNGKNFYMLTSLKVYGGPCDGQIEFIRLNLWNTNPTAVNMAKSELKSIFMAAKLAHVFEPDGKFKKGTTPEILWNKWLVLKVEPGIKDPKKLYKKYEQLPDTIAEQFKDVPPVNVLPIERTAAAAAAQHHAAAHATIAAPASAANPNALPSWAAKKA